MWLWKKSFPQVGCVSSTQCLWKNSFPQFDEFSTGFSTGLWKTQRSCASWASVYYLLTYPVRIPYVGSVQHHRTMNLLSYQHQAMTEIQFENNPKVSINGTCLQGYIETTYDELVKVFGKPTKLEGDKVTVEWILQFSDGTVASIYDWKLSETPMEYYPWHIGGMSRRAVDLVTQTFNQVPIR